MQLIFSLLHAHRTLKRPHFSRARASHYVTIILCAKEVLFSLTLHLSNHKKSPPHTVLTFLFLELLQEPSCFQV